MAQGIQIFDADGLLRLDMSANIPGLYATFTFTFTGSNPKSYNFTIPGMSTNYDWFALICNTSGFMGARDNRAEYTINPLTGIISITYWPIMYSGTHSVYVYVIRV
jgi:hypothetical protein